MSAPGTNCWTSLTISGIRLSWAVTSFAALVMMHVERAISTPHAVAAGARAPAPHWRDRDRNRPGDERRQVEPDELGDHGEQPDVIARQPGEGEDRHECSERGDADSQPTGDEVAADLLDREPASADSTGREHVEAAAGD